MAKKYNMATNSYEQGVPCAADEAPGAGKPAPFHGHKADDNAGYSDSQQPTAADPNGDDKVLEGLESHLTQLAEAAANAEPGDEGPATRLATFKRTLSGKLAK
jgi:hypothetical protein